MRLKQRSEEGKQNTKRELWRVKQRKTKRRKVKNEDWKKESEPGKKKKTEGTKRA